MLLPRLWRWLIIIDCEILCSPDTLCVLLTRFASMGGSMALDSTNLGLPDLVWLLRFLQLKKNFFNHLVIVLLSHSHFHVLVSVPLSPQRAALSHHVTHMSCPANDSLPKLNQNFPFPKVWFVPYNQSAPAGWPLLDPSSSSSWP